MYSKDQATHIKQAFWTAFGQYIAPQPSADGLKISWINYKTGIKNMQFKMQADAGTAFIAISMSDPDPGIQELQFEQFLSFKNILKDFLNEEWEWQLHTQDENYKTVSRIIKLLPNASIFKQEDWPELISFFKPRIIALDEFWCEAQYSFDIFK